MDGMNGMSSPSQLAEDFYNNQEADDYEESHTKRFDFLIEDLALDKLKDSKILDVGCGMGFIFKRMPKDNGNIFVGIDGFKNDVTEFAYRRKNLDYPFADDLVEEFGKFDFAFMFEVAEHIANLYSAIYELKLSVKPDGILYISIPSINVQHNTLYPGIFFPVENFRVFLKQMALEIVEEKFHNKRFEQHVFVLRNKSWDHVNMMWPKTQWTNEPPHYRIN